MEGHIDVNGLRKIVYYRLGICVSYNSSEHRGIVKLSEYNDDYGSHFMHVEFDSNDLFYSGDIVECTLCYEACKWVVTEVVHLTRNLGGGYAKYLACMVIPSLYNDYIIKRRNQFMHFCLRDHPSLNPLLWHIPPFHTKTLHAIIDLYKNNEYRKADQKLRNLIFAYVEKLSIKDVVSQYHICYSASGCRKGRDSWDEMYVMIRDKMEGSRWSARFYDPYIYPHLLHSIYLQYDSEDIIMSTNDIVYQKYIEQHKDELDQICLDIENEQKKYFWANYNNAEHKEFLFLFIKKHILDGVNELNNQIKEAKKLWGYDDILFNNRNKAFDNYNIRKRGYAEWLLNIAKKHRFLWTVIENLQQSLKG